MNIRRIEKKDDAEMAAIIRRSLEAYHLDRPETAYTDPQLDHLSAYYDSLEKAAYFTLSDEAGELTGGAGYAPYNKMEGCCELQKLYVRDEMRGKGYGRRILEYVMHEAENAGYEMMYLESHSVLREALSLYEKCGFQRIRRPENAVHSAMDVFMVRMLKESGDIGK